MRALLLIGVLCVFTIPLRAQKYYAGISLNPSASAAVIDDAMKSYAASVNSEPSWRLAPGLGFWAFYELDKNTEFQGGLCYMDAGFQRHQAKLQLGMSTYPGVGSGKIMDNSVSGNERSIDYNYKFHYIQIPVMVNYRFKFARNYKLSYSISAGIAIDLLAKHEMVANLTPAFYIDGKDKFHLDSTGLDARVFNCNIFLGGRIDYQMDKKNSLFIQPLFSFFPLSATANMDTYLYTVSFNVGIKRMISKVHL